MNTETHAHTGKSAPAALRLLVFVVAGAAALFWLYVARASVAQALPLARDVRLGFDMTLVFLLLVWPALILTISNFAIRTAAALAGIAAVLYGYVLITYLPSPAPATLLVFTGVPLVLVMLGSLWMFASAGAAPAPSFERVKLRVAVLYVAGIGTVLWLASFIPVIERWGDKQATGFHVIPAFYGTIFFLAFVVPLMVMGLRGSERRRPNTALTLLVVVLIVALLFGLPLLVSWTGPRASAHARLVAALADTSGAPFALSSNETAPRGKR